MFSFKFAGRLSVAVAACVVSWSLASQVVEAQTYTPSPTPPVVSAIDGNEVDLVSGKMSVAAFDVGIGGPGSGLSRTEGSYGDSFRGVINLNGSSSSLSVTFNGSSEVFNNYQSASGSSNTLSCSGTTCLYTLSDGTVASYDTTITTASQISGNYATLTSITRPDGEVIQLRYSSFQVAVTWAPPGGTPIPVTITIQQPVSVTSSLGWMLKYHYLNDNIQTHAVKVEALNTSVDYCDPATITCPNESQTWPYALLDPTGPTDMMGHHTNYAGTLSTPTSIVSPSGVTRNITYSGSNVHQVTLGSSTWTYAYTVILQNGTPVNSNSVQDPNGGIRTIVSNGSQVLSDTDPMGRKVSYVYYATTNSSGAFNGAVSQVISPDATWSGSTPTGGYTQYAYDGRGNVTSVKTYPKGGGIPITVSATYPNVANACILNAKTCNKPLTVTDANGITTTYAYDSNSGNIATITMPTQANGVTPQTRYTYAQITPYSKNSSGILTAQAPVWRLVATSSCMSSNWNVSSCAAGATDERITTVSYGTNSNPTYKNVLPASTTVSRGDGSLPQSTAFTYDSRGNVTTIDGPKTGAVDTAYYFYDALNRQTGTIGSDPDGTGSRPRLANKTTYDNDGRVSEVAAGTTTGTTDISLPNALTTVTRDTTTFDPTTGVPSVAKHFIGSSSTPQTLTQTSYDLLLRIDCMAGRLNPVDYGSLPVSACSQGTTGADGSRDRIIKYAYDNDNAVLNSQSPYGTALVRSDIRKVYNSSNGTLASVTDAKGNVTSYTYDLFNRLVKTCYPTASNGGTTNTSDCQQKTYGTVTVSGTARAATRPSSMVLRDNQTISVGYDAVGRVSTLSGAVSETYNYDNFGQLVTHVNNTTGGSGVPSATETYSYNALGWLGSDAQPSGTVSYQYDAYGKRTRMTWPDAFYVTYAYDDGDEITGIYENGSMQIAGFGYDAYGRRNALTRGNGFSDGYGFDGALRLQTKALVASGTSNTITLGYNQADQITSRTNSNSTFAPPTPTVTTSTGYTIDGLNRIGSAGSSSLAYDTRGNMTSDGAVIYTYNANDLMTSTNNGASFVYDAENRLQSYTAGGATTKFLYDGTDLIAEYNGTTLQRRYVHGPATDEPLVWYEGSGTGTKRYLMADERGSVVGVTDALGNVLAVNTYDAYGVPSSTNNTYAGRFRYTGQTYLPELGIYYYKARMYAPTLGRFMQTDPIGYADGMNWYAYVHGDPMNGTDPSGRANCIEHHAVSNVHFNGTTGLVTTTLIGHYDFDICGYLSQMQRTLNNQWEQSRQAALGGIAIEATNLHLLLTKKGANGCSPAMSIGDTIGKASDHVSNVADGALAFATANAVIGDEPGALFALGVSENANVVSLGLGANAAVWKAYGSGNFKAGADFATKYAAGRVSKFERVGAKLVGKITEAAGDSVIDKAAGKILSVFGDDENKCSVY